MPNKVFAGVAFKCSFCNHIIKVERGITEKEALRQIKEHEIHCDKNPANTHCEFCFKALLPEHLEEHKAQCKANPIFHTILPLDVYSVKAQVAFYEYKGETYCFSGEISPLTKSKRGMNTHCTFCNYNGLYHYCSLYNIKLDEEIFDNRYHYKCQCHTKLKIHKVLNEIPIGLPDFVIVSEPLTLKEKTYNWFRSLI